MIDFLITVGGIMGGLGLFLLAVKMITDGLKLATGDMLRDLLSRWTSTPARGIASGLAITAIVQSSSAVTVATIGFVNAGFLTLYQALGVVYGANIGTTMTGWLVAVVGFKIKVELFALPFIGIGMLLRLTGRDRRLGAVGEALAGFGLFFIGIEILRDTFEHLVAYIQLDRLTVDGVSGLLLFLLAGFLLTALTQSSSAAIAIVLTAASGGVMSLTGAAAMVIGANVGTTTTAALAVIGATANARRVAAAHIIFNLVTAGVALLLLPLMLWLVRITSGLLGLEDIPAVTLALFHTVFNVLGVIVLWPVSARLSRFLSTRFVTLDEIESRPRYLDRTVIESPVMAMDALVLELQRLSGKVRDMGMAVLSAEFSKRERFTAAYQTVEALVIAIGEFVARLEREKLPPHIINAFAGVLRAAQYYSSAAELSLAIAESQGRCDKVGDEIIRTEISQFKSQVSALLSSMSLTDKILSADEMESRLQVILDEYARLKPALLNAGVNGRVDVQVMSDCLDQISRIRRLSQQYVKGNRYVRHIAGMSAGLETSDDIHPQAASHRHE